MVVARSEIEQLVARYAYAIGLCDVEALCALYLPVFLQSSPGGEEGFAATWRAKFSQRGVCILSPATHIIDVESRQRASGVACSTCIVELDGDAVWQYVRYLDRYEVHDDRWLFAGPRQHELWFGQRLTTNPFEQPPADWPQRQVGRGTVPFDDPAWRSFWATE